MPRNLPPALDEAVPAPLLFQRLRAKLGLAVRHVRHLDDDLGERHGPAFLGRRRSDGGREWRREFVTIMVAVPFHARRLVLRLSRRAYRFESSIQNQRHRRHVLRRRDREGHDEPGMLGFLAVGRSVRSGCALGAPLLSHATARGAGALSADSVVSLPLARNVWKRECSRPRQPARLEFE